MLGSFTTEELIKELSYRIRTGEKDVVILLKDLISKYN